MIGLKKIISSVSLHLIVLLGSLITSLVLIVVAAKAELTYQKMYGIEAQRFYLLLLDYSEKYRNYSDRGFGEGARKEFETILNSIRYREQCNQSTSQRIKGAMSCSVHGQNIDYVGYEQ